jgi:UDP-2,4-diacetamido-2,4,6-trideoxy-beta-L-altropyranose hydrolase
MSGTVPNPAPPAAPIYFRCDAGSWIGLGHLIRSLALAHMLRPAFQAHFLVQNPEPGIVDQMKAANLDYTVLPETHNYYQEAANLRDGILAAGDLVVLDGYPFDTTYQEILRQKNILLVCIDDLQAFPFTADLIINQAGGVNPDQYRVLPHTRLCLGPEYALLREPFLKAAQHPRTLKPINRVLLNMGGADPHNDTCRILEDLIQLPTPIRVVVVTGSAYPFGAALSALVVGQPQIQVHRNLPAAAMCRLMQSCDAAILPPSSVSYEWCSVGGPLFLYQTAGNQAAMKSFLLQEHLAEPWENFGAFRDHPEAEASLQRQLHQQRKYFGGQSPKNLRSVFHQLYFGHLLTLSPARPEDMMILFEWTNDPAVRENSFSQSPIPLEVHKIWFENKIKETTCLFLIARVKGIPAGMIRYDLKQQQGVISYLIAPDFRGKSLGTIILQKGEAQLQKLHPEIRSIIGHVQQTNLASVISFQRAHYTPSHSIPPVKPGAVVFEKAVHGEG